MNVDMARPRRVLLGFIYTARASSLLTRVRLTLFRAIVSLADGVISYSRHEAALLPAIRFKIICDSLAPLKGLEVPANVEVLRTCVGGDYFSVLRRAQLAVVPQNFTEIWVPRQSTLPGGALDGGFCPEPGWGDPGTG